MYAAHYGIGLGFAAVRPQRGAAFYLAVAAIAPDLPASVLWALEKEASLWHGWFGLLVVAGALVGLGQLLGQTWVIRACAVLAMLTHVPMDRLNPTVFAVPSIDFAVEVGCLVLGTVLYARRSALDLRRRFTLGIAVAVIAALQGIFDFLLL
jgi:hypothetical protein